MVKAATRTSIPATGAVSLKVTLEGVRPPIWRRVLVPGAITLGGLSEVIQAAMGWDGGHLHAFNVAGRHYGDPGLVDDVADEDRMTLNGIIRRIHLFPHGFVYVGLERALRRTRRGPTK